MTIWAQLPFVQQATTEQRQSWYDTVRMSREAAERRRHRVLTHPDLAARLIRCGYSRPENWNGFVPPSTVDMLGLDGTMWARNDSPVRAELIEILRSVAEREAGG